MLSQLVARMRSIVFDFVISIREIRLLPLIPDELFHQLTMKTACHTVLLLYLSYIHVYLLF